MARTIDNLGVDTSTRYAEDRKDYDESFIKEARLIPSQTHIAATTPSYSSEFDMLFELGKQRAPWAFFLAPSSYYASRRRLFSELLIPDLGGPDLQEAQLGRVNSFQNGEDIQREKEILAKLLENLHDLDQLLIDINSRRSQYQKG